MKKCLSVILVLILVMSSMALIVHAESADLSDSGEDTDLTETSAGSVESAISWAINIANDDSHGYSQRRRTGPDYDCSSFVNTALKQAGFALDGTENTGTMKNAFVNAGFTWIPASSIADFPAKSTNLKRGDVLLGSGHTALYIGNDKIVHAINGTYDIYDDGHPGDQTGNEIAVKPFSSSSYSRVGGWLGVLRYGGPEAIDLGSKFYANIVPTATDTNGLASTGANEDLAETGGVTLLWPVEGHTSLSRGFAKHNNKAIDINDASITGATIRAALGGTVVKKFTCSHNTYPNFPKCCYGYGTGLAIKGTDNRCYCYGHMQYGSIPGSIEEGSKIIQGQIIGKVGKTGCCDGPCLHFEICKNFWPNSDFVNPEKETYIYSTVNPQDLGEKFYANIVPTGASSSLAVTVNGSNVELGALDYSDYQKWLFERQDDRSYKITNAKTKKCLDVAGGATDDETNIRVYDSNNSVAQKWFIVKNGKGYYLIPKSNTKSAMDIRGGNIEAGKNIQEYKINNSPAQCFTINKTVDHKDLGASFYANILCSNKNFAVSSNSSNDTIIYKADFTDYQKWLFERQADMTYKITNLKTGKVLDVAGAKKDNYTNIRVYDSNNTVAQKWYIAPNGDGYSLIPKCNIDGAMDVEGGSYKNNTNVHEWSSKYHDAQRFYIQKTVNHKDIGESFYANIVSNDPAYSVAVNQDDNVILQPTASSNNQKWLFERQPDKTYKITNVEKELVLDVVGGHTDNYTNIRVYASNDTNAQRWYVISNGDGYSLVPKSSIASALDTNGGELEDGTMNVHQWTIKLHEAQRLFINQTNGIDPDFVELEDDFQLNVGDTKLVTVTIGPEEADQRVTWISENPNIVTIDENGNVTAVGVGKTYISATASNGLMARCEVTVLEPVVCPEYILLSDDGLYMDIDQTWQLNASVFPEEANQTILWRSENEEIVTVDDTGLVTAVAEGNTIITVQSVDGLVQAYCSVTVFAPYIEPERVERNGYEGFVNEDDTIYLVNYQGEDKDIEIPANIGERAVNELSSYLLSQSNQYTKVTIPATITEIGYHAIGYYVSDWSDEYFHEEKLDITIYGYKNSAAEVYAQENGFTFVDIEASISTEQPTVNPVGKLIRGDADSDGTVTILDATCIQRYLAQYNVLSFDEVTADADGYGEITILDATAIQRYLATFENIHHIGEPIE